MMPPSVVVTGISGRLGRLLTRHLHRLHPVIGIDRRPLERAPSDVRMHRIDLRSSRCEDIFRTNPVQAVIHLNIMHDPRRPSAEHHEFNIRGTRQVLQYCARYDIPKVVVLSTANVYGTGPRNISFLNEEAPLMGAATLASMRSLIEVDHLATAFFWQRPKVETVVLRPVHILGSVHNAPSNYLRLPRIPRLLGFDPIVQALHEEDVVRAIIATLAPGARGVFNVTGPEPIPLTELLRLVGKPTVDVPYLAYRLLMKQMYRARLWAYPPDQLDHLRFGCMVDGARIRSELDFTHTRSLQDIAALFRKD